MTRMGNKCILDIIKESVRDGPFFHDCLGGRTYPPDIFNFCGRLGIDNPFSFLISFIFLDFPEFRKKSFFPIL